MESFKAAKAASLLLATMFLPLFTPVNAQEYPSRPIRLVIPWPPGGITDVISRTVGVALSESLGQQVVPDNRPGAAGTLGVSIAAHANPDGYTLVMTDVPSHAISASLYKTLTFNPAKDVEPIALPSRSPLVLVVNPKLGVNSIPQLIAQAKSAPGKLSFASSGPGSITHLTAERFVGETGTKMLHVPARPISISRASLRPYRISRRTACCCSASLRRSAHRCFRMRPRWRKPFPDS
jgi:tripartite-type tricarboxylate transporter receptor subunit TctC